MAGLALLFATLTEGALTLTIACLFSVVARDSGPDAGWWWFPIAAFLGLGTAQALTRGPLAGRPGGPALAALLLLVLIRLALAGDIALWDIDWATHFLNEGDFGSSNSGIYLLGLILLTATWGRGLLRGRDDLDLERLPRSLAPHFGLAVMFVLVAALAERAGPTGASAGALFVAGVIALAASQLAQSGASIGEVRAGGVVGTLLALTLAATTGAALLAWLVLAVTAPVIGPPLAKAVEYLFIALFLPPAWLLEQLFSLIGFGNGLSEEIRSIPQGEPPVAGAAVGATEEGRAAWKEWAESGLRMVLLVAVLAAIYAGYRAATRFFARRAGGPPDETPASAAGSLMGDLRSLFHRPSRPQPGVAAWRGPAGLLYADVLQRAERAGRPRAPAETPHELAPALSLTLATPVTDEITAAFEEARYAGREPSPEIVAALRRRWEETT